MDAWQELADEVELVETEEAMGEDDGVLGFFCRDLDGVRRGMASGRTVFGADVGVIVLYCRAKV